MKYSEFFNGAISVLRERKNKSLPCHDSNYHYDEAVDLDSECKFIRTTDYFVEPACDGGNYTRYCTMRGRRRYIDILVDNRSHVDIKHGKSWYTAEFKDTESALKWVFSICQKQVKAPKIPAYTEPPVPFEIGQLWIPKQQPKNSDRPSIKIVGPDDIFGWSCQLIYSDGTTSKLSGSERVIWNEVLKGKYIL